MVEAAIVIDPTRTGSAAQFTNALIKGLNDYYNREKGTNVYSLMQILGQQMADIDIETQRVLNDLFLKLLVTNEQVLRGYGEVDQLITQGAFLRSYIGFVPEGSRQNQVIELSPANMKVILERLPADSPSFVLMFEGADVSYLIDTYSAIDNSLTFKNVVVYGEYTLTYTDKGCTLYSTETDPVILENGQKKVYFSNKNVLFDSERIYIKNSAIGVLQRDRDYTISYPNGIVTLLPTGITNSIEVTELEVSYRYRFLFETLVKSAFFEQVFNERVAITGLNSVQLSEKNIGEVFRLFNTTTKETYTVTSISRGVIDFTSQVPLEIVRANDRLVSITQQQSQQEKVDFTFLLNNTVSEGYQVQTLNSLTGKSKPVRLIQGGRQVVPSQIKIPVFQQANKITLKTGSLSCLRANSLLLEGFDYTAILNLGQIEVNLTDAGKKKIGTNSLYAQLEVTLSPYNNSLIGLDQYQVNGAISPQFEDLTFTQQTMLLTKGLVYLEPTTNGDLILGEKIVVIDSKNYLYEEGKDYNYDAINKTITIIFGSSLTLDSRVRVLNLGQYDYYINYNYSPDIIVCDYSFTKNGIDWSSTLVKQNVKLIATVETGKNAVQLSYHPADPNNLSEVKIYSTTNANDKLRPLVYDTNTRVLYVDPPLVGGDYYVEYVGYQHTIDPTVPYYVSYYYGARDDALRNTFAPLIGLTTTTRRRYEDKNLRGGQTVIALEFPPTNIANIAIFLKDDSEENTVATVTSYNQITNTITCTPLRSFGTYTIAYDTANALTEDLRKVIIGLINSFLLGPTKASIEQLVETFTGITPKVAPATSLAFPLKPEGVADPNQRSGKLNDVGFIGQGVDFVPGRYNLGIYSSASKQTNINTPAITNVNLEQGTIQFLLGPGFNGGDLNTHYFIDIGATEQYFKNRISLYKNERGYLVFEMFDGLENIRRVAAPILKKRTTFTTYLAAGSNKAILPVRPAFSTTDIDNNGVQDLLEAPPTEFVIKRVYGSDTETIVNNSPLQMSLMFQIKNDAEYGIQAGFDRAASHLLAFASAAEAAGAIVTIHASPVFLKAQQTFNNVLKYLENRGHEIGLYLDAPSYLTSIEEQTQYIAEALTIARDLGLSLRTFSINGEIREWKQIVEGTNLELASGYIDPIYGRGLEDPTPKIRRVEPTVIPNTMDLSGGSIGYAPGSTDLNFNRPITKISVQQIESSFHRALSQNVTGTVSTWYATFEVEDFSSMYFDEVQIIKDWIQSSINPWVRQSKAVWSRLIDSFAIFRTIEAWFMQQDAETQNILDRGEKIVPLEYNWDTKEITFEPVKYDGVYLFDYITGWTAYEESEIFIAGVYKLHTRDGSLPYYRLYINGELQDCTTFADLQQVR